MASAAGHPRLAIPASQFPLGAVPLRPSVRVQLPMVPPGTALVQWRPGQRCVQDTGLGDCRRRQPSVSTLVRWPQRTRCSPSSSDCFRFFSLSVRLACSKYVLFTGWLKEKILASPKF